ncbi:MAG: hypothetical protein ABFR95_07655 [Actinomycetota bacterium]
MTIAHETRGGRSDRTGGGPGWQFTEWLLGIVGGIAAFLGLFILFAGEEQYVGIGGDWSWRVGEISTAWTYGLLVGGGLLLIGAIFMVVVGRDRVDRDHGADRALAGLLWHGGIFLAVNAFIWLQDIAIGGGLEYAYWVTIPWAVGLAVHASMFLSTGGDRR